MLQQATPTAKPTPRRQVKPRECSAEKCCHCGRELPTGKGVNVPYVGVVGPECVKKYAALLNAIEQAEAMEAYEWDEGTLRLTSYVHQQLLNAGLALKVVDVRPGVKAIKVLGLRDKPKSVVESWERRRARFEQQLQLAAAERAEEGAA